MGRPARVSLWFSLGLNIQQVSAAISWSFKKLSNSLVTEPIRNVQDSKEHSSFRAGSSSCLAKCLCCLRFQALCVCLDLAMLLADSRWD